MPDLLALPRFLPPETTSRLRAAGFGPLRCSGTPAARRRALRVVWLRRRIRPRRSAAVGPPPRSASALRASRLFGARLFGFGFGTSASASGSALRLRALRLSASASGSSASGSSASGSSAQSQTSAALGLDGFRLDGFGLDGFGFRGFGFRDFGLFGSPARNFRLAASIRTSASAISARRPAFASPQIPADFRRIFHSGNAHRGAVAADGRGDRRQFGLRFGFLSRQRNRCRAGFRGPRGPSAPG